MYAPGQRSDSCCDPRQILVERLGAPRVERRHRADDPRLTLRDDKLRRRGDEHRPRHDRKAEAGLEPGGEGGIGHSPLRQAIRPSSRTRRSPTWAWKAAPSGSGQMLKASVSPGRTIPENRQERALMSAGLRSSARETVAPATP